MTNYINSLIKAYPVLSNEEIRSVCFEMHNNASQKIREENRNRLALSFTKYAFSECKKYVKNSNSEEFADMFSEVIAVLLEKAWDYDPENAAGACFITFVQNYVKDVTSKAYNGDKTKYLVSTISDIVSAQNEYMALYGSEPSVSELSAFTGMSERVIKNALVRNESCNSISLNAPASSEDSDTTFGDMAVESLTSCCCVLSPEETVLEKLEAERIIRVKEQFSGVERFIVEYPKMSERKAVVMLKEQYGITIARTSYQNLKNKTLAKFQMRMERTADNFEALAA